MTNSNSSRTVITATLCFWKKSEGVKVNFKKMNENMLTLILRICLLPMLTYLSLHMLTIDVAAIFAKKLQSMRMIVLNRLRDVDNISISVMIPTNPHITEHQQTLPDAWKPCVRNIKSAYSILNSLRSAWTRRASLYIILMFWMICM